MINLYQSQVDGVWRYRNDHWPYVYQWWKYACFKFQSYTGLSRPRIRAAKRPLNYLAGILVWHCYPSQSHRLGENKNLPQHPGRMYMRNPVPIASFNRTHTAQPAISPATGSQPSSRIRSFQAMQHDCPAE